MARRDCAASGGNARSARLARALRARVPLAFALALVPMLAARADLVVPLGGQYTTGGAQTDLGCTDVVVAGTLLVSSGSLVNVRHVTIAAGGTVDGGSGVIQLGGNWSNGGAFTPGSSTVRFNDLCGLASATIGGSTTFFNARFASTSGKNHVFEVGTTQTVGGLLQIVGTTPNPIQFRSNAPGQVANINLLPQGTQSILHVGVTDVWATGQHLAPNLTNEGGGGNAFRWFGSATAGGGKPIPTLGDLATLALAALLAGFGVINLRRRGPVPPTQRDRIAGGKRR